jgi:hypothetical protein
MYRSASEEVVAAHRQPKPIRTSHLGSGQHTILTYGARAWAASRSAREQRRITIRI